MRVLLTVHQFLPKYSYGTEVLTRDTGLELLARGHEVHVLTTDPESQGKTLDVGHEDYDYRGLKVHSLSLPKRKTALDAVRDEYQNDLVAEHVRRYVRRLQPDVVHAFHLSRLSASLLDVFGELDLPVVFTPTDFWSICVRSILTKPSGELSEGPDDISSNCLECRQAERWFPPHKVPEGADKQKFYREIAERALERRAGEHPNMALVRTVLDRTETLREKFNGVDAILAPTDLMHRMLTTNGIDPSLVNLSPYGMDTSGFRKAEPRPEEVRDDTVGLRIGYIGSISPQKGLKTLLEAFERLPRDERLTLRVCGDLRGYPEYASEVYALAGGDQRINFAGTFPNEKMARELGKIDVLVVPSTWYENAPLVIYSALAAGVPVVASNLGGMAGIIRHGENGLLFEPGDAEDLTLQLGRLVDEPGLLARLRENAGEVRSVSDSVDEMLGLYERLLKERNAAKSAGRAGGAAIPKRKQEAR